MHYGRAAQTAAFALAAAVFLASVALGLFHSIVRERRLPPISLGYLADADRAFNAGEFEIAADRYRISTAVAPDDDRAFQKLGMALQLQGRLPGAIAAYTRSLRLNPTNPMVHYNLGLIFAEQGAYGDAVRHDQLALYLQPNFVEAHTSLATVLLKLGKLDEARSHLETALRLRPDFAPAVSALQALSQSPESYVR